jgi:hypothetical protein
MRKNIQVDRQQWAHFKSCWTFAGIIGLGSLPAPGDLGLVFHIAPGYSDLISLPAGALLAYRHAEKGACSEKQERRNQALQLSFIDPCRC